MAINTADPQNVIISSTGGPWKAHSRDENSESFLYMRSKDGEKWILVIEGLPDSKGTIISMVAASPK